MNTDEETTVANPYRAAIAGRREQSRPLTQDFAAELDDAVAAMNAGAWISTAADTFFTELTGHVTTCGTAAEGVLQTYQTAIDGQPAEVPPNSWQTHWRNLR
ncbi:hypothetical protein [Jiangella mangrovi]|uniref:WXG100 family type VII secretion target n=1 Tax=Jiangella mangrovi TaxID=1524084 RepID=A0A7W9GMF3_9ACTN|nr:hypothetical protein [Jiangella mangrovi]MBB5786559.1 hypothetical protein [Jiangella mangrovi]